MKAQFLALSTKPTALLIAFVSMAYAPTGFADAPRAGDEYSNPSPGAAPARDIMARDSSNLACKDSLCTLFSVNVNKQTFTITSYVGTSQNGGMSGGTGGVNNYYGNTTPGGQGSNEMGYGIQITWEKTRCTKNVNVDKSVYDAVTTYMRQLINSKPGEDPTYPQFTPAEQTMILFYTTVMDLTKGTTCN